MAPFETPTASHHGLRQLLQAFPLLTAHTTLGVVQYRQAGDLYAAPSHVLLHGIGSNSASWVRQLASAAGSGHRVLAWDAPGYGGSALLDLAPDASPSADDYARRLWAWLDAVGAHQPITLVGHSLGCLMAAAAALQQPQRVQRLLLLSPAQGYARASAEERQRRTDERLRNLRELGPQGMANKRGAAMLSTQATAEQQDFARWVMAQVRPDGYAHATRMLAQGDLLSMVPALACPVLVASGSEDSVTPPEGCRTVAQAVGAPYVDLPGAGHLCAVQSAGDVAQLAGLLDAPRPASPATPIPTVANGANPA
jgi:pimeloyl-ACP methyl ester carboxylesterase